MPTTRKRNIKTVYKDENSDEEEGGDFSDSGSDAIISEASSSEDDDVDSEPSSVDEEFDDDQSFNKLIRKYPPKKSTKPFIRKVTKRKSGNGLKKDDVYATIFSIRNLSKADKSLPAILNLSESDSSDEETPRTLNSGSFTSRQLPDQDFENNDEVNTEYKNVWSNIKQVQDDSEQIAKKTFMELEQHKSKIEETKATLQNYTLKVMERESDVRDLLALGEGETPDISMVSKKSNFKKRKIDSDSDTEDWEEVKGTKPQQGIQLLVEFPDAGRRKTKTMDIEMMMKRKMNRVKKEYQGHMHKVHVLCWLGHGNYISGVLNDRVLMATVLSLVPSKERRPLKKVGTKYIEEIVTWYKSYVTLKLDRNEDKFKTKSPPLKALLLDLIKTKIVTSKKYLVFIFVALMRALGLQCRVMFNFVTLPIKPPADELCSLSTKAKTKTSSSPQGDKLIIEEKKSTAMKTTTAIEKTINNTETKVNTRKAKLKKKNIAQIDGNYDNCSDDEIREYTYNSDHVIYNNYERIMQVDGIDDRPITRRTRSIKRPIADVLGNIKSESLSKISRRDPTIIDLKPDAASKRPKRGKNIFEEDINDENDHLNSDDNHFRELTNITSEELIDKNTASKLPRKSPRRIKNISSKTTEENICSLKISRANHKRHTPKPLADRDNNEDKANGAQGGDKASKNNPRTRRGKLREPDMVTSEILEEDVLPSKVLRQSLRRSILKAHVKDEQNEDNAANKKTQKSRETINSKKKSKSANENIDNVKEIYTDTDGNIVSTNADRNTCSITTSSANDEKLKNNVHKKNRSPEFTEAPSRLTRKRSQIANSTLSKCTHRKIEETVNGKRRTKINLSFSGDESIRCDMTTNIPKISVKKVKEESSQDKQLVSRKNLTRNNKRGRIEAIEDSGKSGNNLEAKSEPATKRTVKGKIKEESDEDVDYSPIEEKHNHSDSDDSFKPKTFSPKTKASRREDRRGLSLSNGSGQIKKNKVDIWCEVFDEELGQWISVDVIEGKVTSTENVYANATPPVCYVVGWDNNNNLKDLTRKYVPHYNTETRKLRVDPLWWSKAVLPYLGPKTLRDKEEDEYLNKIQLEAPLPTVIGEYKNHPLYVLKRHLLKFEALYPPDPTVLGFVRGEPVYARECVYTCRSRNIWYKDHAKVVKLGEKAYKLVKARPRWDKINRKVINDDPPLEIFGPWQVEDFVPPIAENGIVPRNEYGNVELFKACMLPRGTVHLKLPGLNKIAKKLNIDCATAITGFEVLQGWVRPVYDGFVVCKEFEDIIADAWADDQEEQDRKAQEKSELRIYGHWKRLIKGMLIRERLKNKYGFDEPATSVPGKDKSKGPKPVAKRKRN